MKVIFLDVDGVINCQFTTQKHGSYIGIDPYMALLVDRIIQATGAKVVLSSTWRLLERDREIVKGFVDFIDITPDLGHDKRWDEVQAWLNKWNEGTLSGFKGMMDMHTVFNDEITKFAIIDDNWYNFPKDAPFLFKTSWMTGITQETVDRVIKYLNE